MKKLCMEVSVVVLQVPFTWDFIFTVLHMQHAHTPFQKLAIALAIGFSSESVLKYERLKDKKRNLSAWWFKFFFIFFLLKDNFFLMKGEEKLEYMR